MAMRQDFPRGRAARVMRRPGTRTPAAVRTVRSPFGEQAGAFSDGYGSFKFLSVFIVCRRRRRRGSSRRA